MYCERDNFRETRITIFSCVSWFKKSDDFKTKTTAFEEKNPKKYLFKTYP